MFVLVACIGYKINVVASRTGKMPTASPSRKPKPVTFDPGVFDLCEKCHVSCCRDLGHDYDYSEPSSVL